MALNPEQITNRLVAVLMPILLAGFLYGIVTGKNVGPTHKQMKIMKAEMKWIMQEQNANLQIHSNRELSKSGVASANLIVDPELWRSPSKENFESHGWKLLSKGTYCKEGIQLEIHSSLYMGKAAVYVSMRYDAVTSDACKVLASP
jgi:hypothetical protein